MSELGRLQRINDLRLTWPDEARDFTPWLARPENLQLLSEFLGLGADGLEVEAVEKFVGPYRADILCRDTVTGDWVLIENQLEKTDHNHLGQLLVYAAGLDAKTVVWISKQVQPEHKAAMEWLNTISDGGPAFFALEIELWRIGSSPLAPQFNAVVTPNTWTRSASAAKKGIVEGELSDKRQLQRAYWERVEALIAARGTPLKPVSPQAQSWISHGIGKSGFSLNLATNSFHKWIRAEVYLSGKQAKARYAELLSQKDAIEHASGFELDWQELPEGQDCRICKARPGSDPSNEETWPEQHDWLVSTAVRMHGAFRPFIAQLGRISSDGI